jgi:hypothetical protein
MKKLSITSILVFMALTFISFNAQAYSIFFGEDLSAGFGGTFTNSIAAQQDFLSNINNALVEDFESFSTPDPSPIDVDFGGTSTATLNAGRGELKSSMFTGGPFATSGTNYFYTVASNDPNTTFTLTFSEEQAALGFFATDFESAPVFLLLESASGVKTVEIPYQDRNVIPHNESALFFGIIDTDNPFTKVTVITDARADGLGFDDFTIATASQILPPLVPKPIVPDPGGAPVPEPGTLLLLGAGLAGLVALQRRKRK